MAIARIVQLREPVALLLPRHQSSQNISLAEVATHMEVFFAFQPRPVLSHYSNNSNSASMNSNSAMPLLTMPHSNIPRLRLLL